MQHNNPLTPSDKLRLALADFRGTDTWYSHGLVQDFLYTKGAKYFIETTNSYWLLDVIATEFHPLQQCEPFLVIKVESQANTGRVVVTDGNENVIRSKKLTFTTLIPGTWLFYLMDNVLLLPTEY